MKKGTRNLVAALGMVILSASFSMTAMADVSIDTAKRTALEAASRAENEVIFVKEGTDLDDGRQIFEVDFIIPGEVKYEFDIDPVSGRILDQDMDLWEADDEFEYAAFLRVGTAPAAATAGEITSAQAQSIAAADTGLSVNAVTFTKCARDVDDGVAKFEVEFTDGVREFDYDIRISDGAILERGSEFMDFDD